MTKHDQPKVAPRVVEVEDYTFMGRNGPVRLTELFCDKYLLVV